MRFDELKITQSGLARARSQEMVNTLYRVRQEFAERGLADSDFVGACWVVVARELTGGARKPAEPGLIFRLSEGESGKVIDKLLQEIFDREPDDGDVLDYDVNIPGGGMVSVRVANAVK